MQKCIILFWDYLVSMIPYLDTCYESKYSMFQEMTTDYERGDYWCLEFKHQDG